MNIRLSILLVASAGIAAAEVPHKMPLTRYYKLWNDSPLTTKPAGPVGDDNPFQDYALGGVSPVTGGYQVTLLNKKKPEERLTLSPGQGKFRVVKVQYDERRARGVVVSLSNGSKEGTVTFDDKLLALKTPAPQGQPQKSQGQQQPPHIQPPSPPVPSAQPSNQPQQPSGNPNVTRQPRQRVFPPNR